MPTTIDGSELLLALPLFAQALTLACLIRLSCAQKTCLPLLPALRSMSTSSDRPKRDVWSFPRPPALNPVSSRLRVVAPDGTVIADTTSGFEVLETRFVWLSI